MERITLYHQGAPVMYHPLRNDSFSIGSHPENDLVLASEGVKERHLVIYRKASGKWYADHVGYPSEQGTDLERGTRIALGAFAVGLEASPEEVTPPCGVGLPFNQLGRVPELDWAGDSALMRILKAETKRLGPLRAPVIITGESGTGKELVARGLHGCSRRSAHPFVPVNCGGLTESLLEDTLFGHERGSFTGAGTSRKGVFEQAHLGTVFLDEIGELPINQQAVLLRVLDDRRVRRIGSETPVDVNFRLVTATNRDLKRLVKRKLFRLDLYHRISTLAITTTPLRDRTTDLPALVRYFFSEFAGELGLRQADAGALAKLAGYNWPGNVRELRNVLYRTAAFTDRRTITARDIDVPFCCAPKRPFVRLNRIKDDQLTRVLDTCKGNVAAAARILNVPRTSLRDRVLQME